MSVNEITLRPATADDLAFFFALHKESLGPYVDQVWGWEDDDQRAYLERNLVLSRTQKAEEDSAARDEVIVYANHLVKGDPDAPGVEGGDALFTLGVEGIDYESIVPRWFKVRQQFSVACDMVLSLIYISDGYIQQQLITAVAAAEAFHEALGLEPSIPNAEFKAIKKALKSAIPRERRKWLSEKLGRNNPTLRERLLHLASRPDQHVMRMLLPNPEGWADAAKNSRNLVAHGGGQTAMSC